MINWPHVSTNSWWYNYTKQSLTNRIYTSWGILYIAPFSLQHANFDMNANFIQNDIALIQLATPVDLSDEYAEVVPMANKGDKFLGADCRLTGWGRMSGFGE